MTVAELLRWATSALGQIDIDATEARIDAEVLIAHALGVDRAHLYTRLTEPLPAAEETACRSLLVRRLNREPTAYITGQREFYGLELRVTPAVLIPRPETELVVDETLAFVRERSQDGRGLTIADVGAGSGAIAIALAYHLPGAIVYAIDTAPLELARENARRHNVANIIFLQGNLLEPLPEPVDMIAANLPYVPTPVWETLPPEIRDHEPRPALDGGPDGLVLIRGLLQQAPSYLRPNGLLVLEIGSDQGERVQRLAREAFPGADVQIKPDLAGLDRLLLVRSR